MDSEKFALDEPNFEADTSRKLADYYIIGQRCLNKVRSRYNTREALAPHWEAAEQAWYADPDTNPTVFPTGLITSHKLHEFYRKCDNLLEGVDDNTSTPELIRAFFAANNGAMLLHSFLVDVDHELSIKIARKAGDISEGTLTTPAQLQAVLAGMDPNIAAEQVGPGDILRYTDIQEPNIVRAVLIKPRFKCYARRILYCHHYP